MANCCQKVRGNETNQRRKQQQNKILKQNNTKQKNGKGNFILQVLFHRLFREIHLNFIYRFYFTWQSKIEADARIFWTCMPPSRRCSPLPFLFVSLVSYICTLLPALFTPVAAPVPNHSHPVCARAVWSVHALVAWASLCLGSPTLHGGNAPSVGKFFLSIFSKLLYLIFFIKLNSWLICVCVCVYVCVRACVRLSVSACVCMCVRACVCVCVSKSNTN